VSLPPGAVTTDTETNQMTIRVPRSLMDPGTDAWRYVIGAGLWSGSGWRPGNSLTDAPAVFNLGFRFSEPQGPSNPSYTTIPGVGNWFEDAQAAALAQRTDAFHADIDFGKLAAGVNEDPHPPGRIQARIYASQFEPYEGVRQTFPSYGTRLQPYILVVPQGVGSRPRLTLALHSGNSTYTQYAVNNPNLYKEFGDDRRSLVLTPFGRGPDTNYIGAGEADVIEALGDVQRHFDVDRSSLAVTGYSMGGYGAWRLAVHWPDLFGRLWTGEGLPAYQGWAPPAPPEPGGQVTNTNPLVDNLRWVPLMQWAQVTDEINPYSGVRAQQDRLGALGLRSQLWTYTSGDHFSQSIQDQWQPAADFLGSPRVKQHPSRVDYAFLPEADAPDFGLRADHAYWVSDLRARTTTGDPQTAPARAEIVARSLGFGQANPVPQTFAQPAPQTAAPSPTAIDGTTWARIARTRKRNALRVKLQNIRSGVIDGVAARLTGTGPLRVRVNSDGPGSVRLKLRLPDHVHVAILGGSAGGWSATADRNGVTFDVQSGTRTFVISGG
jgi:poly(3-hydroxybutyrate) depolymerase